jgi:hypothetical protein
MGDPALRAALFRFVDVRPACATPQDVTRHLHELLAEAEESRLATRATCSRSPATSAPTCTSTWSPSTPARRSPA